MAILRVADTLSKWQHGFIEGRSCETQLVLTHHIWALALDEGLQVDVAFLHFCKAFDRVSHPILSGAPNVNSRKISVRKTI